MKIKKIDLIDKIAQQAFNADKKDKKENNAYTVRSMIKDLTKWEQFLSAIDKENSNDVIL